MIKPYVSVIMPVYNCEKFVKQSIDSILNQTFQSFEFIIIDDGSTDNTPKIVQSYSDSRICFIQNEKNIGLAASLNIALGKAKGKYIVRMDGDDISLPQRIEKQVCFMEENPHIDVSSAFAQYPDKNDVIKLPLEHNEIISNFLFSNPLIHPLIILRKNIFRTKDFFYDVNYKYSQDYELWTRMMKCFRFGNLDEILLNYNGLNHSKKKHIQQKYSSLVKLNLLKELKISKPEKFIDIHNIICYQDFNTNYKFSNYEKWLNQLLKHNKRFSIFPQKEFENVLNAKWYLTWDYFNNNEKYLYFSDFLKTRHKLSYIKSRIIEK